MTRIRLTRGRAALLTGTMAFALTLGASHGALARDCASAIIKAHNQWKLNADCTTSSGIVIPGTVTLFDGQNHTVTASSSSPPPSGAIVEVDGPGGALALANLKIQAKSVAGCDALMGLALSDRSATVNNVHVLEVTHNVPGCSSYGINVRNQYRTPIKVTIRQSEVKNYEQYGIYANDSSFGHYLTVDVSGNDIGAATQGGAYAGLALELLNVGGTVTGNTIKGNEGLLNGRGIGGAVTLDTVASGFIINGNNIGGISDSGIQLVESNGVSITNNQVINDSSPAGYSDIGIDIYNSNPTSVSGNTIRCFSLPLTINNILSDPNTFGTNTVQTCPFVSNAR